MATGSKRHLTKPQVARAAHISTRTLERWIADGYFPKPFAFGRRRFWLQATVTRWIDGRIGSNEVSE